MHNKCFESKQVPVPRPLILIMISGKITATNMGEKKKIVWKVLNVITDHFINRFM